MISEDDASTPLRLSYYIRNLSEELAFPLSEEKDFVLRRRLESRTNLLRRHQSWKDLQTLLETEAVSRVAVKEHLNKLYNIAQELPVIAAFTVDDLVVLLLHLFMQEPVTSVELKQIVKYVCGSPASSVILHRIYKVVHDIKHVLPSYTVKYFEAGKTAEKYKHFGTSIKFNPINRNTVNQPDTSHLHEIHFKITSQVISDLIIVDFENGSRNDGCSSPEKNCSSPAERLECYRFDEECYEEVNFRVPSSQLKESNYLLPVSELNKTCQILFKEKLTLNGIESLAYEPVFTSNENVLVAVPLGFDKTTIISLAVLTVVDYSSSTNTLSSKVLYLLDSIESAELKAAALRKRLEPLKITVTSITTTTFSEKRKTDLESSQVIVTAANIWKSVTHKMDQDCGDIRMLIIDEMNSLSESQGPALEIITARVKKQMKCGIPARVLGFTTTLLALNCAPSLFDVAEYLHVDRSNVLIFSNHKATVLPQVCLVRTKVNSEDSHQMMVEKLCCKIVNQAMSRIRKVVVMTSCEEEAIRIANIIKQGTLRYLKYKFRISENTKNKLLTLFSDENLEDCQRNLCLNGYLTLHSRISATARSFICNLFKRGLVKLIVTTPNYASLLAGQADTVIINDTVIYDEEADAFIDTRIPTLTDMLEIATCSYDKYVRKDPRKVVIIVDSSKFEKYSAVLQNEICLESQLLDHMSDILNSEILLTGMKNITECERWFRYTFLYHTMKMKSVEMDVKINWDHEVHRVIQQALNELEKAGMIRYQKSGSFVTTELGHIASYYQIPCTAMEFVGKCARKVIDRNAILDVLCEAPVFSSVQISNKENEEVLELLGKKYCEYSTEKKKGSTPWKVNILLQVYLSGGKITSPRLKHNQDFIVKEMKILARAMFEMYLHKKNALMAERCLNVAIMIEMGNWKIKSIKELPKLEFVAHLQVISSSVFQVHFIIKPDFVWQEEIHGESAILFWIWVVDSNNNFISNHSCFHLTKKVVDKGMSLEFCLPITAGIPLPMQYVAYVICDKWLGVTNSRVLTCKEIKLPETQSNFTETLDLQSLPVSVLQNNSFENLYSFNHFSPTISQTFHVLYHNNHNMLIAASSMSNLVIAAEIAIFRAMSHKPGSKVLYLTKWKSEVEEKKIYWQDRFKKVGWKVMSFSGRTSEDIQAFFDVDVVLATTQDWELSSRSRLIRKCLADGKVSLVIVNDLHLIDAQMEIALSQVMAPAVKKHVRLLGLSQTSMSYINDMAKFLRIPLESPNCVYNFGGHTDSSFAKAVQIIGYNQGNHSARFQAMRESLWDIIKDNSCDKTVIILVHSREQLVMVGLELKKSVLSSRNPKVWCSDVENMKEFVYETDDLKVGEMLKHGIGLFHSGMSKSDCNIVQTCALLKIAKVFVLTVDMVEQQKVPCHLIIVCGTEVLNVTTNNYIDIPVPEIINKMYSCCARWTKAVILTDESRKAIFQTYFQGALLVESQLLPVLPEYLNNEIAAGVVLTRESAIEHVSRTFLGHRVKRNPSAYWMPKDSHDYCSKLVDKTLSSLQKADCIIFEDSEHLKPTVLGTLSSLYNVGHATMKHLSTNLKPAMTQKEIVLMISAAPDFKKTPVRVQDEQLMVELEKKCPWSVESNNFVTVEMKVFLLLQSHFSRLGNHLSSFIDYKADLKIIVDHAYRIMQSLVVICCDRGFLVSALQAQILVQMLQSCSWGNSKASVLSLPHINSANWKMLIPKKQKNVTSLPELQALYCGNHNGLHSVLKGHFQAEEISEIHKTLRNLPMVNIQLGIFDYVKYYKLKDLYGTLNNVKDRITLSPNQEYSLSVAIKDIEDDHKHSWILILGYQEEQKVLAMKKAKSSIYEVLMTFTSPKKEGDMVFTLYVMSNSYVGLDQQFDIHMRIAAK